MYDAKHAGGDCVVVYQANRQRETAECASPFKRSQSNKHITSRNMRSSSRQYC